MDSKSRRFILTPPCFILSPISHSGWLHLESTCPCNGAACKFVCDCHALQWTPSPGASTSCHHVFVLSLVSCSGWVHVKTQWGREFFTSYAAAYSIFTPYAAAKAHSLSSYSIDITSPDPLEMFQSTHEFEGTACQDSMGA
jgi:hypothetical protein